MTGGTDMDLGLQGKRALVTRFASPPKPRKRGQPRAHGCHEIRKGGKNRAFFRCDNVSYENQPSVLRLDVQSVTPAIQLRRTGTADEVAKAVAFLAFRESSYISGSELFGRRSGTREWPVTWNWKASHRLSSLRRRICR